MEVKASLNNIRISPRKVRLTADLVRGLSVENALSQLNFNAKLARFPLIKLINSAVANAVHNFELEKNNLVIKEIRVDGGATLKRWMPKAHGRATPILKKTSHISLILGEIVDSGEKKGKKKEIEPVVKISAAENEPVDQKAKTVKKKEKPKKVSEDDKAKVAADPRMEGRRGHAKVEGGAGKGFVGKMFRRKSG
jgi:large subunit ribosomal protein L22